MMSSVFFSIIPVFGQIEKSFNNCVASGGGCPGCSGASTLAQPAPRQSCAPMAGKPAPSSHEPPRPMPHEKTTETVKGR